ncbi:MAG: VWA domain-containing protein [Deltaproteobacteria bacterium]|nr:VWA domain-containing protein [Deltaproteobacteria bacterium]MBW2414840.1 VWA domain-containing protein [Deltaproteobacteria bacterium]
MSGPSFAEPQMAHLFWLLAAALAGLFWLERRGGADLARFVAPPLQSRLVSRPARWRRRLRLVLLGLSAACAILALMRPQWGLRYVVTPRVGAEIMIALDVSRSMLSEDVPPSRLDRAKAEIADLLTYLDGDQVGLIAFAGRATVLSPLTPDFGFLRLVLDGAGPHSVARGGTRLEEPLRKALAGFGAPGEASRAILLITDGEDHDSFPLDAAEAAAELGVRIIAIGFGDEAGSEIRVRDPRTGVRSVLLDSNGNPVRSRLDGELLRKLALTTDGAYVPAGTGVLDLESIYDAHIAGLVRARLDGRGRTQRDEAYAWAVLASLLLLLASTAVASGGAATAGSTSLAALLAAGLLGATPAAAQTPPDPNLPGLDETVPSLLEEEEGGPANSDETTPRERYNRGLAALADADLESAERWLGRARREARDDGELRHRAAYNLGLVASARSDVLRGEDLEAALPALEEAASWFRRAVQLDPEDADARHNLEVSLRRALLLADELARRDEKDLTGRLEDLAGAQRGQAAGVAELLEALPDGMAIDVDEAARRRFGDLATSQRTILSDADQLASNAADERDAIDTVPEAERAPEQQMRAVQLTNALHYLHRARGRMGQARQQLRERQGERGYRRSAAALDELKRALDQLREPLQVLDALIREATRVAIETGVRSGAGLGAPPTEDGAQDAAQAEPPAWLSDAYLAETQTRVAERTGELGMRLRAGLESEGAAPAEPPDPQQQRALEAVREAEPLVERGHAELAAAAEALEASDLAAAMSRQRDGVLALLDARERFLDLRGLIETAYAQQAAIAEISGAADPEAIPGLVRTQSRNLSRGERLRTALDRERDGLQPDAAETEHERFTSAATLLELARGEMDDALDRFEAGGTGSTEAERARSHLAALRRLFFSIVEHVRETAEQQLELSDETRDAAALDEPTAPLASRQERIASRAGELAAALEEMSRAQAPVPADPDAAPPPQAASAPPGSQAASGQEPDAAEKSRILREAGEHVLVAGTHMREASGTLAADSGPVEEAQTSQTSALEELAAALALLTPPEPQQGESGEQQQASAEQDERSQPEKNERASDPAQLLQEVRDREAQRRRDRERRSPGGYETVEKDW